MQAVEAVNAPLLEVCDLACERGDRLLFEGVSFALAAGALLQIEGPNGSGKTSLLRVLAGLSPSDAGEVRWRGLAIGRHRPEFAAELLYLGHLPGVHPNLTPLEHLRMATRLGGWKPSDDALRWALGEFGLSEYTLTPSRALSEGQRRRAGLARLLVSNAALWVLDEPLSALDVPGRACVESALAQHCRRGGVAILSTHQAVDLDNIDDVTHLRFE
ncbi:MAG: cytochrome c biogenesis heme-transporting ATPase CcmA [Aquisalimonadaceae bacterium]